LSNLIQTPPQKKLLVWATIREAFGFAWDHRRVLWGWIVIGALLAGLVDLVNLFEYGEEDGGLMGLQYFAMIFLLPIPSLLVFGLLAVYCHRTFLIYQKGETFKLQFFFTQRERKFFAWVIGIPLCALILMLPGMLAAILIWYLIIEMFPESIMESLFALGLFFNVVILFPFYYILGRWILVFPVIAIDQEPKLGWS
jgi:hypothetical protein